MRIIPDFLDIKKRKICCNLRNYWSLHKELSMLVMNTCMEKGVIYEVLPFVVPVTPVTDKEHKL